MFILNSVKRTLKAVVLLAMLPAMCLILYSAMSDRSRAISRNLSDAEELVRVIAYKKHSLVESTRTLLLGVSRFDEVTRKDLPAVRALFRTIIQQTSFYSNLALLAPDGTLLCAAHSPKPLESLYKPELVGEAVKRRGLYIGRTGAGVDAAGAYIEFAYPVHNGEGGLASVIVGGIRTDYFRVTMEETRLPPGARLRMQDKRSNAILTYPEDVLSPEDNIAGTEALARQKERAGIIPLTMPSGETRTVVFRRLFLADGNEPYMTVLLSLPTSEVFSSGNRELRNTLLLLGLSVGMAFLIIRLLGENSITGPVRAVLGAARRLHKGDLSARADLSHLRGEMKILAKSFNDMAGAIEARELDLIRARNASHEYDAEKSEFLAAMSHAIRTPMNSVIGIAYLLMKTQLSPRQYGYVNRVYSSANTLLGIINDILDFSNIEAGRFTIEHTRFSLSQTVENVLALCAHRAEERSLTLGSEIAPDVPDALYGDPLRLSQVLTNIIGSAVKFTEQGGVRVCCFLANDETPCPAQSDGPGKVLRLRFEVRDTGIGMTAEQLTGLFNAFTQADETISRRFGGTGLGLAITKRLVELMGGSISAESEYGQGTTMIFTICLRDVATEGGPRASGSAPARKPALSDVPDAVSDTDDAEGNAVPAGAGGDEAAGAEPLEAGRLTGVHILLVEDNQVNQEIATALLQDAGARVSLAGHGGEALAFLGENNPACVELVLMDVRMPVMDGYEATQRIRQLPALAKLPIIAMTAHAMLEERERCFAAGMDAHISKPLEIDKFFSTINECLQRLDRSRQS